MGAASPPPNTMNRKTSTVLFLLFAFLGGYSCARWNGPDPSVVSAGSSRQILFYRCPMHPAYKSDKPGLSPCCHMALEPVYADDPSDTAPAGATGALRLTAQQQQLAGVQYGIAEYTSASPSLRGPARVGVNEKRVARVESKLEGWIDEVFIHASGENVKQGQVLFTVYNRKAVATQLDYLHAMDLRMSATMAGSAAPASQIAAAEGMVSAARQRMDAAGFTDAQMDAIGRSRRPAQTVAVLAPIAGTVLDLQAVKGQMLTPATMLTIADLSTVWVTADFTGVDAAAIHPGQPATLRIPILPGRIFSGAVDAVLPNLDPATGSLQVRLQFDNRDLFLRPEMFGEIELRTMPGRRTLTVPAEALIDSGRSQAVFLDLGGGSVESRAVTAGRRFGDRVEIVSGLQAGQRIVTSGNFLLDSESRMRQGK
jgi:Cu(I)/Ag(I) efflux system membrane fusion protein